MPVLNKMLNLWQRPFDVKVCVGTKAPGNVSSLPFDKKNILRGSKGIVYQQNRRVGRQVGHHRVEGVPRLRFEIGNILTKRTVKIQKGPFLVPEQLILGLA